jgi:hypothetical protein
MDKLFMGIDVCKDTLEIFAIRHDCPPDCGGILLCLIYCGISYSSYLRSRYVDYRLVLLEKCSKGPSQALKFQSISSLERIDALRHLNR